MELISFPHLVLLRRFIFARLSPNNASRSRDLPLDCGNDTNRNIQYANVLLAFNHFFGYPVYTDNQGSIELLLLTVCIFTLLSNLKLPTSDSLTGKITSSISKLTLGAYLSSWVYNRCVMLAGFLSAIPFNEQLRLLPLCFILVAIPSFLTSAIITRIADLLTALVNRLHFS